MKNKETYQLTIACIAIGFVIWSLIFIYRSSFIAIDGQRYFSLLDDAMISMRYAWNLSHGNGLVWNPGERVEGYTNLLMVLFMSLATLLLEDKRLAVLAIQLSGIIFMLGSAYLTIRIADQVSLGESQAHRRLLSVLVFFCTLSYYPLVYWSLMGMETGLLTLLLLWAVFLVLRYTGDQDQNNTYFLLPLSLGLAYLTRPDSLIPAAIILVYFFYGVHQSKRTRLSWLLYLGAVGLYLLFPLAQTLFRWQYYAELLPNTYILKVTGIPLLHRLQNGLFFIEPFLRTIPVMMLVMIMGLIFNFRPQKLLLVAMAMSAICYQVWAGGDPWRYWRMMSPVMPLMISLFVHEILLIVEVFSRTTLFQEYFLRRPIVPHPHVPTFLAFSLTLLVLIQANWLFLPEVAFVLEAHHVAANRGNVNHAVAINHLTTPDATVGVIWAGSIPYYTGRLAIDFLGKADKHVARLAPDLSEPAWYGMRGVPGHNKYDLHYSIKQKKPTYVQDLKWGQQDISTWAEDKYVEVEYKGIRLYLDKDSPAVLSAQISALD